MPFLQAAAQGLGPTSAAPVQIGACRAIVHLCQRSAGIDLQPYLSQIYQGDDAHMFLKLHGIHACDL